MDYIAINAPLYQWSDFYNDVGFCFLQFQITCKIVPSREDSPKETLLVFHKKGQKKCEWTMTSQQQSDTFSSELLTCPNERCVKMYQRHSGLEKHLLFGQCKMVPERCTLLDLAKKKYHALLVEGLSEAVSAVLEQGDISVSANTLPEGWALSVLTFWLKGLIDI